MKRTVCTCIRVFFLGARDAFSLRNSLADVLSCEDHVARPTSEAADVPLLLQRQEGLTLLDLVSTPSTVWKKKRKEEDG